MKISKLISAIAAAACAASMIAVSASATDWAKATYADDNPDTCKIVSTSENEVKATATADGQALKVKIVVGDILDDDAAAKVKSAKWNVTYEIPEGTPAGNGLGGAAWFACKNSSDYWISPDYDDDGNPYWGSTSYNATSEVKFILPTEVLDATSELVFMDWSNHEAMSSITVSYSDLKFYDADGNEIAQKAYTGAAPAADAPAAPAADNGAATTSAGTGNTAAASIAAVMAVAGVAAIAAKKRK